MKEKVIEQKLTKAVKAVGGLCLKFISPSMDGVPDRIMLMPGGRMAFAELKAPGKKLRPIQKLRKQQFERLGFRVYVIDDEEHIQKIIADVRGDVE